MIILRSTIDIKIFKCISEGFYAAGLQRYSECAMILIIKHSEKYLNLVRSILSSVAGALNLYNLDSEKHIMVKKSLKICV